MAANIKAIAMVGQRTREPTDLLVGFEESRLHRASRLKGRVNPLDLLR